MLIAELSGSIRGKTGLWVEARALKMVMINWRHLRLVYRLHRLRLHPSDGGIRAGGDVRHRGVHDQPQLHLGILLRCRHHLSLQATGLPTFIEGDDMDAQLLCDPGHALPVRRAHPPSHVSLDALSGDSENWSGGDTKTGPPRGASQAGQQGQSRGAISGADGSGDSGADPSGRGGDATAIGSRLGPAANRQRTGLFARDGAQVPASGWLAALREALPQHGSRRAQGVAAAAVSGPPRQCRCGAAGAGQREGNRGEPAHGGACRGALAAGAAQRRIGDGAI